MLSAEAKYAFLMINDYICDRACFWTLLSAAHFVRKKIIVCSYCNDIDIIVSPLQTDAVPGILIDLCKLACRTIVALNAGPAPIAVLIADGYKPHNFKNEDLLITCTPESRLSHA